MATYTLGQRQENCKIKINQDYIARLCLKDSKRQGLGCSFMKSLV